MFIINILMPVFILVFLGFILDKINLMDDAFFKSCARFTYWVALPVLLFSKISSAKFAFTASWKISTANDMCFDFDSSYCVGSVIAFEVGE